MSRLLFLGLACLAPEGPAEAPTEVLADTPAEVLAEAPADASPEAPAPEADAPERPAGTSDFAPAGGTTPETGGFGSVDSVSVDSTTISSPFAESGGRSIDGEEGDERESERDELTLRASLGYVQTDLGNLAGLDHHGAFVRLEAAYAPWTDARHRVGAGLGVGYTLFSFAAKVPTPAGALPPLIENSRGFAHLATLSFDTFFRIHEEWFTVQPSFLLGMTVFDVDSDLWIANRAGYTSSPNFFVTGGSLGLCTARDILCVLGGSEYIVDVRTTPLDPVDGLQTVSPFTWHVALGVDIGRLYLRFSGASS